MGGQKISRSETLNKEANNLNAIDLDKKSNVMGALATDLLNSLTAHIAVLDSNGVIVAVNDQWKHFAEQNQSDDNSHYIGANYLATCEEAVRNSGDEVAKALLEGVQELLQGKRRDFMVEYPCHSPDQPRWFVVRITRFSRDGETYLVVAHENITEQKLAAEKLRETETTLRMVLDNLPVGVWIMDHTGKIIHGNPAGQQIWGGARYVGPEQFGEYKGWWLDSGRLIAPEEWAAARAIQKGETSLNEEVRIECFDGSSKIILNSAIPLRDVSGNITGAVIVNQDITRRKLNEERLLRANTSIDAINQELQQVLEREQRMARTDDLTGLNNRRHFFELGEKLFAVACRYKSPLSILIFDIDMFKQINDDYGHQAGDRILISVAGIAQDNTRDADILARYGGEEFIMILPNTNARGAMVLAESVRKKIAAHREKINDHEVQVTISTGIADILPDEGSLDHLIKRADLALYDAKNAGRNCSRIYSPTSNSQGN